MTVELTGPQGYEYQYFVTAYIGLLYLEEVDAELIVESIGGEDAELIFGSEKEQRIEIQVKGTNNDLTLLELTEWLSHFPNKKAENNLINRLKNEENKSVLFVTKGRASDETRPFLKDSLLLSHSRIANKILMTVCENMKNQYNFNSPLMTSRRNYCNSQSEYFKSNKNELENLIKKLTIWEQLKEDTLEFKCKEILRKKYFMSESVASDIMLKILEKVRNARDERGDVLVSIRDLINIFRGNQIQINNIDVERPNIEMLKEVLKESHVLLLTGISFCGKSHTARKIANDYQKTGYNCFISSDVNEISRFLLQTSTEDKLCIVEDPLGQINLKESHINIWGSLENIIMQMSPNCKIIITSKVELLKNALYSESPTDWKINDHEWFNLTVNNRVFIQQIWHKYCQEKDLPESLRGIMDDILSNLAEENLLQPGQLRHIAFNKESALKLTTSAELIELATIDARKIGMYFMTKPQDFQNFLMALALGASHTHRIKKSEIVFILSPSNEQPSINAEDIQAKYSCRGNKEVSMFPKYNENLTMPMTLLQQIDDLESHGYINVSEEEITFAHPTYYEAARHVLKSQRRVGRFQLISLFTKGISSLEVNTAYMFSTHLNKLYDTYILNQEYKSKLIHLAINALHSIFPSVRDMALVFLLNKLDDVESGLQQQIYDFIKYEDIENESVKWEKGEPWIKKSASLLDVLSMSDFEEIDKYPLEKIAKRLINPDESIAVSSEEAWYVITGGFRFENDNNNLILFKRLLSYKESFIRAKTAFEYVKFYSQKDKELLSVIFEDIHPNVIRQAVRGAFNGWHLFSEDYQKLLIDKMKKAISNEIIAAKVSRFITNFENEDEYGAGDVEWGTLSSSEKKKLWNLWGELFPVFLKNVPEKFVFIDESNFFHTIMKSSEHLTSSQIVNIAHNWLEWIESHLSTKLLYGSGYAVSDYLLIGTSPTEREHLTTRILNQVDTNFITVAIATYIDNWGFLGKEEKGEILSILKSDRIDIRWINAVCLTRTYVPKEITMSILNIDEKSADMLFNNADNLINILPQKLLSDCLRVYSGHPHPLGWLGHHHYQGNLWHSAILKLIDKPECESFYVAFPNFVEKLISGRYNKEERAKALESWKTLIYKSNIKLLTLIYETLEMHCIEYNGAYCIELWEIFFAEIEEKNKRVFFKKIIKKIEAFNYYDDMHKIFGKKIAFDELLPLLEKDDLIFKILFTQEDQPEDSILLQKLAKVILGMYSEEPPRLTMTNKYVKRYFINLKNEENEELLIAVNECDDKISKKARNHKEELDDHYILDDWVSLHEIETDML